MTYNYVYPDAPINELNVIQYAAENGYYLAHKAPFTSPANMVRIAQHYSNNVSSGHVTIQQQGLNLLIQKLQANEPVIIDVLTRLNDPESGAHFVVVTGISLDETNGKAVIIHYNNSLTGRSESANWDVVWNDWQNNPDPGGPGWWMTIHAPSQPVTVFN